MTADQRSSPVARRRKRTTASEWPSPASARRPGSASIGQRLALLVEHLEAVEHPADRGGLQLLERLEAEQLERRVVGEQQPAVGRLGGDGVGDAAEDRLQLVARLGGVQAGDLALLLGLAALGDVADRAGEHRRLGARDRVDRELDRELAAVGAHADQLDAPAENGGLAGGDEALEGLAMALAQGRRDHRFGELAPDRRLGGSAEHLLGRAVELDDVSGVVDRDDRVQGGAQDGGLAGLALAHGVGGGLGLHELADQRAKGVGQQQQVGVGLALLVGEQLDHRHALALGADREGERAAQAGLARLRHARELVGLQDVGEPGRQAALPDRPRQAEAGAHHELARGRLELGRLEAGASPGRGRAQRGAAAHDPQRAEVPSERVGDRVEQARARRGERVGLGEHARDAVLDRQPGGVALAVRAQPRDADGKAADQADRREAGQLVGRVEVVGGKAERDGHGDREQRHDGGVARAGAEGGDHRTEQQQLDQDRVGSDREVDRRNRADGDEREQKHPASVQHPSGLVVRAQPVFRLLRTISFAYIQRWECTDSTAIPRV